MRVLVFLVLWVVGCWVLKMAGAEHWSLGWTLSAGFGWGGLCHVLSCEITKDR